MKALGQPARHLEFASEDEGDTEGIDDGGKAADGVQEEDADAETNEGDKDMAAVENGSPTDSGSKKVVPPTEDEYIWLWKVRSFHHIFKWFVSLTVEFIA